MKKILVTGGAGYIGSHTLVELSLHNFYPIIVDNLCNTSIKNIKGVEKITGKSIPFYNVDCTNEKALNNVFEKEKNILGTIHFAAYKSVEESVKYPHKYHSNNIGSLQVLLNVMKNHHVENIIFSSSCTVYGNPDVLPICENAPFKKAESPYGKTKQLCEELLNKTDILGISLRYFNPIGSHESGLIGDRSSDNPNNLVPIITETAIGKREIVTVFGDDYDTKDGTCLRDYIHVVDLANAHVKALQYVMKNKVKSAFNIGTGNGVSVLEAIHIFEKVNNIKVNYKIGPRRDGDVEQIYSDNTLSTNELEWEAKRTIEEAMSSAWLWEQQKQ
ncbi:MAG: UDP-glucose 4-epimerase GalE [Flavobacteriales bacterium]|nr:UDP-glucose 4-epimerase GalE [Flavobacteriales bacterium]|tara:strand:- start:7563 stop:8555 length:993 start_codon:yes stop_codon:yes gene_type:complete